ncbi:MAG: cytochrome P450 [Actinoallomurus sp.]
MITTEFTERYLLDPEVNADPYPYLTALREHRGVYWSRIHRAWLVTGHAQVVRCLGDEAISADRVKPIMENIPRGTLDDEAGRAMEILSNWMVFNDPPEHRRLRTVFQERFSVRAINRDTSPITKLTEALISRKVVPGTFGDIVADVAKPLPNLAFTRWLGVPPQHGPSFWYWNARVADLVLGAAQVEREYRTSLQSLAKLHDFLLDLVRQRRERPEGEDLISTVLAGGAVGDSPGHPVSEEEFVGMLTHLAFAGGETTSNLIANGMRALLLDPGQLAAIREDPTLVPAAVEEALRHDGPSKMSVRLAARDLELEGETIRAGDRVFLVTAAANRDPQAFADPGRFDVRRGRTPHLGFGFGIHFCIGAALARLVAGSAIEALVRRCPDLKLDGTDHAWQSSLLNRSLTALPVGY